MLALVRPDLSEDAMAADDDPYAAPIVLPIPTERHGYAPPCAAGPARVPSARCRP